MLALDIAAISYAIGGLGLYHLHLYSNVFYYPSAEHTQVGRMLSSANYWTKKHQVKEDPASVTLAIQTLRNTILVAVFVGGNAVNVAISYSNSFHDLTDHNDQIRSIILSILCFCSFLSWVMVIRLASQLGYFVGTLNVVGDDEIEKELTSSSYQPVVPKDTIDLDIDENRENDPRRKEIAATERKMIEENIKSMKLKKFTNLLILMFIFFR